MSCCRPPMSALCTGWAAVSAFIPAHLLRRRCLWGCISCHRKMQMMSGVFARALFLHVGNTCSAARLYAAKNMPPKTNIIVPRKLRLAIVFSCWLNTIEITPSFSGAGKFQSLPGQQGPAAFHSGVYHEMWRICGCLPKTNIIDWLLCHLKRALVLQAI